MSGISDWLGGSDNGGGPVKFTRKKIIWLAAAVLLGVSLLLIGNSGNRPAQDDIVQTESLEKAATETASQKTKMSSEEEFLASKLERMLEEIDGAGKVKVTVRLATSARESYAINKTAGSKNTLEKDQGGGTRTINENNDSAQLVIAKDGKGDAPVVEMESAAQISGVLVVSGGAADPRVKERLFEAVRVSLDVEPHKILVLPGKGGVQ